MEHNFEFVDVRCSESAAVVEVDVKIIPDVEKPHFIVNMA